MDKFGIWTASSKRYNPLASMAGIVNLLAVNPGFETGDATGWPSGVLIESSAPISGSYSAKFADANTLYSDKYSCADMDYLFVSLLVKNTAGKLVTGTVDIRFYNSTPTLTKTVNIKTWSGVNIPLQTLTLETPVYGTQFEIYMNITSAGGFDVWADDFVVLRKGL